MPRAECFEMRHEMVWPEGLPLFPIWNNNDLCDRCFHWWNQSGLSQEQDHCRPMYDTNDLLTNLTADQREMLMSLDAAKIMCPYFEPLTTANLQNVARGWGPANIELM